MDLERLGTIIRASGNSEAIARFDSLRSRKGTLTLSVHQKPGEKNPGKWRVIDRKQNK